MSAVSEPMVGLRELLSDPVITREGYYVVDWSKDDRFLGRRLQVERATRRDAQFSWIAKTIAAKPQFVGEFDSDGFSRYGSFRLTTQVGAED